MSKLAGRFMKVADLGENHIVVGLLGTLKAEKLTEKDIRYLASWYIGGFPSQLDKVESKILDTYSCKNESIYNNFIEIKATRKKYW